MEDAQDFRRHPMGNETASIELPTEVLGGESFETGAAAFERACELLPDDPHYSSAPANLEGRDERICQKWGPAGAINCSGTAAAKRYREQHGMKGKHGDVWLFFGWASH
ncbi:hypothetical protein HYG81_26495 (plasmid) [Natrinema zhouii]|uniref:hypothetical protein n=1 Tax=Natrinema zhouii TaxID=1710539 RepID=UPI001CFFEA84|nr:hypothetical protein [Natrinema zhouii]UHQ99184.1 hypothetical protein HYG81_26495 [Natrinema zhouii]